MRIELIQFVVGRRVFRVFDDASGLCLERAVDPRRAVQPQTAALGQAAKSLRLHWVSSAATGVKTP